MEWQPWSPSSCEAINYQVVITREKGCSTVLDHDVEIDSTYCLTQHPDDNNSEDCPSRIKKEVFAENNKDPL